MARRRHPSPIRIVAALCACLGLGTAKAQETAPAATPLPMDEIADGVFVHRGHDETPSRANAGDIADIGFIVGGEAVAVIDSGGSPAVGRRLRAAIRQRTDLPIRYLINTHVHFDHLFGNGAFVDDAPELVAHARLQGALMARADAYLASFKDTVGSEAASKVLMLPTDMPVSDRLEIDLGGRVLELTAHETAHTNNDLTVFDRRTATLFAGDLVSIDHIPILDGSVLGWLDVLDRLEEVPAERVVPGHGPVAGQWPEAMVAQRRYLEDLVTQIRTVQRARGTIQQAVEEVGRRHAERWVLFDEYHRRNVTAAFAELEWE
ncbi:MAG: quinoprotein relay system zinc metallohydrolase 2 [Inquilinus sp.]|nr:quinoprotein relay system zinc metallohydrolase 2 [Inquilinus sp.]